MYSVLNEVNMYVLRGGYPRGFLLCKLNHTKLVHFSVKLECFVRVKCEVYENEIAAGS